MNSPMSRANFCWLIDLLSSTVARSGRIRGTLSMSRVKMTAASSGSSSGMNRPSFIPAFMALRIRLDFLVQLDDLSGYLTARTVGGRVNDLPEPGAAIQD